MKPIKLNTDMYLITKLHEQCNTKAKKITIDKDTLLSLLIDNSKMFAAINEDPILEIQTPEADNDFYDGFDEKGNRVSRRSRVRLPEKKTRSVKLKKKNKRVRL